MKERVEVLTKVLRNCNLRFDQGVYLSIKLDSAVFLQAMIEDVNAMIKSKMEQDVTIYKIRILSDNQLAIDGHAQAMGINKDFVLRARLDWSIDAQELRVLVESIDVDGGFLVKKGFAMVEPKIREMIESKARMKVEDLLPLLNFNPTIPNSDQRIQIKVDTCRFKSFLIEEEADVLHFSLQAEEIDINIAK